MKKSSKKGFTLVELIIVIAVVAILIAVLIPTFASVINKAKKSAFEQNAANLYKQAALDKLEQGQNEYYAFYTDGNEYMAFNSLNENLHLGTWDAATNTFGGDKNKNFCIGLTNDGYRILLHKAKGDYDAPAVSSPSTETLKVYSLIGPDGEDDTINAARFDPLFFAYGDEGEGIRLYDNGNKAVTAGAAAMVCAYKCGEGGSDNPILLDRYRAVYGAEPPIGALPLFTLPTDLNIPLEVAGMGVDTLGDLTGAGGGLGHIASLTLPDGISAMTAPLGGKAVNLGTVSLPASLKFLPKNAFIDCSLSQAVLPGNIVFGEGSYFDGDVELQLPDNVCLSAATLNLSGNAANPITHDTSYEGFDSVASALEKAAFVDVYEDIFGTAEGGELAAEGVIRDACRLTVPYAKGKLVMEYNDAAAEQTLLPSGAKTMTLKLSGDLTVLGTLEIGALRNTTSHGLQGHITGGYAELDLNGHNLIIGDGGTVLAAGLISDSAGGGVVTVKAGGTLKTSFVVKDFSGGSLCAGRYFSGVAPFNQYCVPYVRAETRIEYGGALSGLCVLYALKKHNATDQTIIGEGGLIELMEADSYVRKTYDAGLETLEIYGKAKSNAMSIKVTINVSTEKTYFPIPNGLTLILKAGGEFTLRTMAKVLPGARVITEKGSRLVFDKLSDECAGRIVVYHEYPNCVNPDHAPGKGVTCTQNFEAARYPQGLLGGELSIGGEIVFTARPDIDFKYCLAGDVAADEGELEKSLTEDVLTSIICSEGGSKGSIISKFQECFTVSQTLRVVTATEAGDETVFNYSSFAGVKPDTFSEAFVKTADGWSGVGGGYVYDAARGIWTFTAKHGGTVESVVFKTDASGAIRYVSRQTVDKSGVTVNYAYRADIGKWIEAR